MVNRIVQLLKLWKNNKNQFTYRLHHYIGIPVSKSKAALIAESNERRYKNNSAQHLQLQTYEGSNQACHPDILFWKNNFWLTITPYPYGSEEYENPCVYVGKTINSLNNYGINPIDRPEVKGYGTHLSDPCLFVHKDSLYCLYRLTIRKEKKSNNNYLYYKKTDGFGTWSDRILLYSSTEDELLSPALVSINNKLFLYYVSCINHVLKIKRLSVKDDLTISKEENPIECEILNSPQLKSIWHIGISREQQKLNGLFLFRDSSGKYEFELYYASGDSEGYNWTINERVESSLETKENMKIPYKSALVNSEKKVLFSYKDKLDNYRIAIIDISQAM